MVQFCQFPFNCKMPIILQVSIYLKCNKSPFLHFLCTASSCSTRSTSKMQNISNSAKLLYTCRISPILQVVLHKTANSFLSCCFSEMQNISHFCRLLFIKNARNLFPCIISVLLFLAVWPVRLAVRQPDRCTPW